MNNAQPEAGAALTARDLARGTLRLLADMGFTGLTEFKLADGRRADVLALGRRGEVVIVNAWLLIPLFLNY